VRQRLSNLLKNKISFIAINAIFVTNTSLRGPKGEGLRCVYCENSKLRSRSRVVQEVGGFIWRSRRSCDALVQTVQTVQIEQTVTILEGSKSAIYSILK